MDGYKCHKSLSHKFLDAFSFHDFCLHAHIFIFLFGMFSVALQVTFQRLQDQPVAIINLSQKMFYSCISFVCDVCGTAA